MPERPPGSSGKRRTLAETVTVHPLAAGLADGARKAPSVLALCLHTAGPSGIYAARVVDCSLAANFGTGGQTEGAQTGEAGAHSGATVAVIRPVPFPRKPAVWKPGLGHLIGLALREAGVPPVWLADSLVVSLYASPPDGRGVGRHFSPVLPDGLFVRPRGLRLRVPDLAGRSSALAVEALDLTAALAEGGLEDLARILRPTLEAPGGPANTSAEGGTEEARALEAEARLARLLLYYTTELALPRLAARRAGEGTGGTT